MSRKRQSEETEQKILDTALNLFLEQGYEQTTIVDIVNSLGGLTRGAFYHHFKSKEEVLSALNDRIFFNNSPFVKIMENQQMTGLEKLQNILKLSVKNPVTQKVNLWSISLLENPRFLALLIENNRKILSPLFKQLLDEGVKDGSLSVENTFAFSELISFMTNFWMIPTIYPATKEELLEKIHLTQRVFHLLGMPIINDEILVNAEKQIDMISKEGRKT